MAGWIELAGRYPTSHTALSGCKITSQEMYHEVTVGHPKRVPVPTVMKSYLRARDTRFSL